ncbi:MAG TPA: hypothetical protein VFV34_01700, partial [Blastocatellia bacterium]|nr:hypothetical protein [Blastocatellia bacterium]
ALAELKPFPAYSSVDLYEFEATSSYHSLQVTLSRQASKTLQYFVAYTFSKALGTSTGEFNQVDPIDARGKSYGVLNFDRTHIFNVSYNYNLPGLARGAVNNQVGRAALDGWQMSGITTFQSGRPVRLGFSGDLASPGVAQAFFGTDAYFNPFVIEGVGAIAPVLLKNPSLRNNKQVGSRIVDMSAIGIPAFGESGPYESPFYIRGPNRWNFDVSLFKNFKISEERRLQFRVGLFNIFNRAYPDLDSGDIDLTLETSCNVRRSGVPNGVGGTADGVCDPTAGFLFTPQTVENFGKIGSKHGHRIIELAFKFYF